MYAGVDQVLRGSVAAVPKDAELRVRAAIFVWDGYHCLGPRSHWNSPAPSVSHHSRNDVISV